MFAFESFNLFLLHSYSKMIPKHSAMQGIHEKACQQYSNRLLKRFLVTVCLSAQLLLSARKKKQSHYRSVISDIFDGSILSLVQCLTCDRVSCISFV